MAKVLITGLDEDTVENYRLKAKIKGISLEQELRTLLDMHKSFTSMEKIAASRYCRSKQTGVAPSLTHDEIREGLE